jgi:hypothetical protein
MSLAMNIRIQDSATPATAKLQGALDSREKMNAAIGTEVKKQVQTHLLGRGRNKKGWPTTNFYPRAAKSTTSSYNATSATVSINQIGVRQRYYGGTIRPVKAKALAIPISPVSYGHVPSDFPGLFLLKTPKGAYLVQAGQELSEAGNIVGRKRAGGNAKRRRRAELNFLFALKGSVYQEPDASVLPTEADITKTALREIQRHVEAATR